MYRKQINKSDTIHQIYSNQKIKQQLIDYIFSVIDLSKFKYKLLEISDDLQLLTTTKHYISGNYAGSNCLMVFTRNKDRYYSFLVDRKTLSYKQSQINIDNVIMTPIELGLDDSIYNGTIIDGILSQTEEANAYGNSVKQNTFIITDLYLFCGDDLTHDKIKYKLINIKKYLDNNMTQNTNANTITVTVNRLYETSEIKNLVQKIIPQTKQLPVKGIAFYPDMSGTKLIYLFNKNPDNQNSSFKHEPKQPYNNHREYNNNRHEYNNQRPYQKYSPVVTDNKIIKTNNELPHNSPNEIPQEIKYRYVSKTDEPVILTFEMRKTEQCDVYKLFLVNPCKENEKTILKTKRFGIAHIPTLECSRMCKELTIVTGKALVKCKYDEKREKWQPIEQDKNKKCPDYVATLEERMDIIVDDE